jgi:predicted lipid-binding transport protein (Tim44 family)
MFNIGFFFGSLPGLIFLASLLAIGALLFWVYRLYRPPQRRSRYSTQAMQSEEERRTTPHRPLPGQEKTSGAPERTKDSTGQPNLDC